MENPEIVSAISWVGIWNIIKNIGALLVVIGVAMELFGDWISTPLNKKIDDARAVEIARANERAANAELELAKFRAPRFLTNEQLVVIAEKLKPFATQEYGVTTYWDMKEPLAFANRINEALLLANWKYIQPPSAGFLLGGTEGIQVWVHPNADKQVREAADLLVAALQSVDVVTVLKEQNPNNPIDNKINLNIGTKP